MGHRVSSITAMLPVRVRASLGGAVASLLRFQRYPETSRILRAHAAYYREARRAYGAAGHAARPLVASPREVGVRVYGPGHGGDTLLDLPINYAALVERVSADVAARIAHPSGCVFYPHLDPVAAIGDTDTIVAKSAGSLLSIQPRRYLDIDGLESLCDILLPQIERNIYASYAMVDKVYVYRWLVSRHPPEVSLLWHFDEHPPQVLKVMVYLTDVDEGTAPFTYLRSPGGTAVLGARHPLGGHSRISDARIAGHLARGCDVHPVTGARGTTILFHDNVIHRATIATRAPRDVVVLQIRPSIDERKPWIDRRWTGSFDHLGINPDPRVSAPMRALTDSSAPASTSDPD